MNGLGAKINGELKSVGIIMIISTDNTDNNYSLTIMLPVSSVFIRMVSKFVKLKCNLHCLAGECIETLTIFFAIREIL